ncbi:TlpA disulfide reductase family protein [Solibacillus sp. FSL R7-0682]|uniref:TlpA family protein disulfide reductase n=1 Tax=Solibacillus sp. FSL R7-0682 TaxID=2921690 RepID=UPI0030F97D9E
MKNKIGFLIVGVLVILLSWNVIQKINNNTIIESKTENVHEATNFKLPTLDGKIVELKDTRGKITILNFWASWCSPCQMEAPHLQTFYENNKDMVEILAVNITSKDVRKDVEKFANEHQITFPVLLDETGDVSTMYGAFTIPTTIFLNEEGVIVQEFVGPMEEAFLTEVVESIE